MKCLGAALANAALAAGGLLFALTSVELGLRTFSPQVLNMNVASDLYDTDPELGAISKKSHEARLRVLHTFDVVIRTNSDRLRGTREIPVERRPGVPRILFLGDSFTFGWGEEDDQAIPARLEALFRESGREVEVLNAAVYAFDTVRYLRWNRRYLKYKPDLTVLGFCLENDFYISRLEAYPPKGAADGAAAAAVDGDRGNPFAISGWYSEFKKNYLLKSHLLALVRDQLYIRFPDIRRFLFRFGVNDKRLVLQNEYPPFLAEQAAQAGENLAALSRETAAAGGELLVFSIPMREQVYSAAEIDRFAGFDTTRPGRFLGELCVKAGIEYLDTLPGLKQAAAASKERYYFETDPHLSPAGCDRMARLLFERLKSSHPELFQVVISE